MSGGGAAGDAPIVIVGGGMAADAACRGVRSVDEAAPILMLGEEPHDPYDRPPLSKEAWEEEGELQIARGTRELGVDVRTGIEVVEVDREAGAVRDHLGRSHPFSRLLLATGARPRRLPGEDEGVVYLRTLHDFRALRGNLHPGDRAAVVGGGWIGCEMAGTLARLGHPVEQFFPEADPLGNLLPGPFARLLRRHLEALGVALRAEALVTGVPRSGDAYRVEVEGGSGGDGYAAVVAGLGVEPRDELARAAGLETGNGIVVGPDLRTADPRIFAAGDVALLSLALTGTRHRIEHEENANESGFLAGRGLAGEPGIYDPIPYLYSRIGGLLVELVGMPMPGDQVRCLPPTDPRGRGVATFRGRRGFTGVLIWNRPGRAFALKRALRRDPDITLDDLVEAVRLGG